MVIYLPYTTELRSGSFIKSMSANFAARILQLGQAHMLERNLPQLNFTTQKCV